MNVIIRKEELVLDTESSIGSIKLCLEVGDLRRPFDNFQYCVANGRQVLLGHHGHGPIQQDWKIEFQHTKSVNYMFVSKGTHYRKAYTWMELRELLYEGWIIGTQRYPGVKIWFASTGRNSRREIERIFVIM